MGCFVRAAPASLTPVCPLPLQGVPISPEVAAGRAPFTVEHVSWLYDANARQLVTAFSGLLGPPEPRALDSSHETLLFALADPRAGGVLRELTLPKCVAAWGLSPPELATPAASGDGGAALQGDACAAAAAPTAGVWKQARLANGKTVSLPRVPAKYLKFLRVRAARARARVDL